MFSHLERPSGPIPRWREVLADFGPREAANGFIGWVFAATAPVAIILSVGTRGGLSEAELASWIFGVFFINGLISILFCWWYRQPLAFFWTIPGTVLVGPALGHLSFAEVIGAFYATGRLMLVLGATGWVKRAMHAVPMPIVMGMVAGVFLRFGLDLIRSLHDDVAIVAPMIAVWLLLTVAPALGRRLPPLIGALLVGATGRDSGGAIRCVEPRRVGVRATRCPRARLVLGRDVRTGRAAGDHRPGGPERPGHCGAEGGGTSAAGRCHHRRLRHRCAGERGGRQRQHLPDRADERDHHRVGRTLAALHRRHLHRCCSP